MSVVGATSDISKVAPDRPVQDPEPSHLYMEAVQQLAAGVAGRSARYVQVASPVRVQVLCVVQK